MVVERIEPPTVLLEEPTIWLDEPEDSVRLPSVVSPPPEPYPPAVSLSPVYSSQTLLDQSGLSDYGRRLRAVADVLERTLERSGGPATPRFPPRAPDAEVVEPRSPLVAARRQLAAAAANLESVLRTEMPAAAPAAAPEPFGEAKGASGLQDSPRSRSGSLGGTASLSLSQGSDVSSAAFRRLAGLRGGGA